MKKLKYILAVLMTIGLFGSPMGFAAASPVYADEIDLDQKGSLTLIVRDEDKDPVAGGSIAIYHVASIEEINDEMYFKLTPEFEKSKADLSNLENRMVVAYLEDWAKKHDVPGRVLNIPETGVVSFTNLPLGLYLVVQPTAAPGYYTMSSFLMSVPELDEDQEFVYDVYAFPKADLIKHPTPDNPDNPGTPPDNPNFPDKPDTNPPGNNTTTTTTTTTTTNTVTTTLTNRYDTTAQERTISRLKPNTAQETNMMQWAGIALISGLFVFLFIAGSKNRTRKS